MSLKSRNPRLPRHLGVRKEFPQGLFNGVVRGFDPVEGYYRVRYEDGDREEMTEDEVFCAARAYRDHVRHTNVVNSGATVQADAPKVIIRRKPAKSAQPPIPSVLADEDVSSLVAVVFCNQKVIRLCGGMLQLWGLVL